MQLPFPHKQKYTHSPITSHHREKKKEKENSLDYIVTLLHYYYCSSTFCSVPTNPSCVVVSPAQPINFAGNFAQKGHPIHSWLSILNLSDSFKFSPLFSPFWAILGAESLKFSRVFQLWAVCTWCLRRNDLIQVQDPMVCGFIKHGKEAMLVPLILDFVFFLLLFDSPFFTFINFLFNSLLVCHSSKIFTFFLLQLFCYAF